MPASPDDLYAMFRKLGIPFEIHEHPPLHTVEESRHLRGRIPGAHCKTLFLKDRKGALFLVVCLEHRRLDMKWLQGAIDSARLSFGRPDLLWEVLGVRPGAVTPFALVNDSKPYRVRVVLDSKMMRMPVRNYHPLHNEATGSLACTCFEQFLAACGHEALRVDFRDKPECKET